MANLCFTENQFEIAIDMSEAKILSSKFDGDNLIIFAFGINILYDFSQSNLHNPDINYDEWLKFKYHNHSKDSNTFQHIYIDDIVEFVINEPNLHYEGTQDQFLNLFTKFDFQHIENPKHKYIFGGIYKDSSHDEFEVHSNSPIKLTIPNNAISQAAKNNL